MEVLNLVINGLPSIPNADALFGIGSWVGFKPCYKWITFNTYKYHADRVSFPLEVLNLVINGLPSIPKVY